MSRPTLTADGALLVQCDPEPLATRYRGRMMILGVDTVYRLVFSETAPMGVISGIQPGVSVQIIIQAVNGGSEGPAREPVIFTMPLASVPAAQAERHVADAELAPLAAILPNGNGNGNGAAHLNRVS